jgi:hypothetical protein
LSYYYAGALTVTALADPPIRHATGMTLAVGWGGSSSAVYWWPLPLIVLQASLLLAAVVLIASTTFDAFSD